MKTSLFFLLALPIIGFAVTQEQIRNDVISGLRCIRVPTYDGKSVKYYNTFDGKWNRDGKWVSIKSTMPNFSAWTTNIPFPSKMFATNAEIGKEPLFVYSSEQDNYTPVNQSWLTEKNSTTSTDSFTYTNSENVELSFTSATMFSIKAPLIGEATETVTFGSKFGYTHTSANTITTAKTIEFPSQQMVAAPYGKTELLGYIYPVNFSGSFEAPISIITGTVRVYPRYYKREPNSIIINGAGEENFDYPSIYVYEDLSAYDIYKLMQTSGCYVPDYIKLDDATSQVTLKLEKPIQNTFTGIAGYKARSVVKFTPFDTSKSTVVMSLSDYQDPNKRATLLQ